MAGQLVKAKLEIYKDDSAKAALGEISFFFNPQAIRVTKSVPYREQPQAGANAQTNQFTHGDKAEIDFGELIFDTFEQRKSVYKTYIVKLEQLLHFQKELHRPPRVLFSWGSGFGSGEGKINSGRFFVSRLEVNYTMFLPDGTPVRATAKLTLTEDIDPKKDTKKNSPDVAKVHLVQRGDTLQGIAYKEYDSPAEWRRIAEANSIDDPSELQPGTRLLVPPILK